MNKLDEKLMDICNGCYDGSFVNAKSAIVEIKQVILKEILKALPTHSPKTLTRNEFKSVIKNLLTDTDRNLK